MRNKLLICENEWKLFVGPMFTKEITEQIIVRVVVDGDDIFPDNYPRVHIVDNCVVFLKHHV